VSEAIATPSAPPSTPTPSVTPTPSAGQAQPAPASPGIIPDNAYDNLSEADRAKYSRVRAGPDGGSQWQERSTLPSETDPTVKPGEAPAVTPDGKLRVGSMELSEADIQQLMTESAAREARKATMPATAADYKLDLPSDFVMPEGQSFQFSTDHPVLGPIIGQAKELAHSLGMDQSAFSKMMGLYAASQVHEAQLVSRAAAAEAAKLGANITARVTAVEQFIRGTVGDDKIADAMRRQLLTADQVIGWERFISKVATQGHGSFTQSGRIPRDAQPGRVSEEAYAAMSPSERWAYAKSFDQREFRGR
jgi:hypothetical protein